MKTIKESIIGRKGVSPQSEVWIMFPMESDYLLAEDIFPEEYKVRAGANYVFCIDDIRWLKRYFERIAARGNNKYRGLFSNPGSELGVVRRNSHFRNLDRIKEWLRSVEYTDYIYQSSYVDVIMDVQKYIKTI